MEVEYSRLKYCYDVSFIPIYMTSILVYGIWHQYFKKKFLTTSNLTVFISGCDTGLGNHLAKYLDGIGCDVFAGCLNPIQSQNSLPDSVTIVPLDVCSNDSVNGAVSMVKNILKEKGKDLWALINNAGVCVYGEFEWQTMGQLERQINVNLLGTMRLTKAFIPLLRIKKGRIITVSSVNGFISYPGIAVYSATKFALEGLSHALRLELSRLHGIKVIIVEPGDFARLTNIMSQHQENFEEMWNNMSQDDQAQYGHDFYQKHRAVSQKYGLTSPKRIEDSSLLDDMKDALLNVNPRLRYISTTFWCRIFYRLVQILPYWMVDILLTKVTNALIQPEQQPRGS